ncbi:MAG: tetratricopeptide repeat protein, partial [Chloroflexota bacterium]
DLLAFANTAVATGIPEVAIPICQNFLKQNQLDGEALVTLSNAYIKQGKESKAIEQMERAASIAPEEPSSWLALANAWSHLGFYDRALDTLHKAQSAIPEHPQVLLALGTAYLNNNLASDALPVLKKGYKLDPDNPQIRTSLAKSFYALGDIKKAWSVLESLEDHFTEDSQLALILGQVLRALNENSKAVPILKFAYQTTHKEESLLEYTYLLLDITTKAQVADDPEFRVQNELEKLLLPLVEQCNTSEQPFKLRLLIADVKCALGSVQEAHMGYLELVSEPNAKAPETYCHIQFGIGKTALALKLNEISLAALKEAVMIKPDKVEIRHALAEVYMMSQLTNEGLNSAKAALQIAPQDLENILWFTQFMIKNDQPQNAILSLKNAIRIAPGQRELYITLAKIYVSLGDHAAAKSIITELTDSEDISSKDMHNAADVLYQLNDVEEAVKVLKGALRKDQQPEFAVLYDLIHSLQTIGESDSALELTREYEKNFVKDPRFPVLKSDILALNLQYGEALECLHPILIKMEYSDDLFNVENALQSDLLDHDSADYSHAGIYWRAAQLERAMGDLLQAQKHAEQALGACPTQLKYLILSAELAFEMLQKEKLQSIVEKLLNGINEPSTSQIRPYAEIICMRCEFAILEDDHETASKLFSQHLSNLPSTPRSLALQAQLADYYNEKNIADTYFLEAQDMFTSLAENKKGYAESISERFTSIWNGLALAEVAVKLRKWNTAFEKFQQAICLIRVNPLVNMLYAKAMLTSFQHQHTCQALRIVKHAPDEGIPDQSCQKLFEEQISIAGRFIEPRIIDNLRIKAQATFNGHWSAHNRIEEFIKGPKDAAAILPLLENPDEISQILGAYPDDFDVLLQYAIILMGTDPNKCREIVRRLIEIDTANPPLHALLAFCSQDDNFIATNSIETALELWPAEPEWHAFAAQLYVQDGQYDLSAQHLEKALEIQPNEPSYWELLGEVKLIEKDFNAAKTYFGKACEIFPDNPEALLSLAQINKKLGEYQSAVTCLEKANELQPTNIQVIEMLANILLETGDTEGAIQKAKELLSMDALNVTAYLINAKALIFNGQFDEAQKFIESAIVKLPDSIELKIEQISLVHKAQGVNEALPHLIELTSQHPDDKQVLYALSTLLIESGRTDEAAKVIHHSLQLDPDQPQVHLQQGRMNRKKGNLDQAIADLSAAIALDPSLVDSYIELGKTYQERREHPQAIQIYKQASQVVSNDPRPYYHVGLALKECKDYKNAEAMLRQAAQLAPKDASVRRQLAAVVALNLVHNLQEAS